MSLVDTCLELAGGDGHEALHLTLLALAHGASPRLRVCAECGAGFESRQSRFCCTRCRKRFWQRYERASRERS